MISQSFSKHIEKYKQFSFQGRRLNELTYDNRMYGLIDVLIAYSKIESASNFAIRVQHGLVEPHMLIKKYPRNLNKKIGQFLWCQVPNDLEIANVHEVGSPFLYLPPLIDTSTLEEELVVVPHGGTFNNRGPSGLDPQLRHKRVFKYFQSISSQKNALLYWHDFLDPKVRKQYADLGIRVHCAGFPGLPTPKLSRNNVGGQSNFLFSTKQILGQFKYIRLFEPTTAAVYASSIGATILFDASEARRNIDSEVSNLKFDRQQTHRKNVLFQISQMEKLLEPKAELHAKAMLGVENKKTPDEMAKLLDFYKFN